MVCHSCSCSNPKKSEVVSPSKLLIRAQIKGVNDVLGNIYLSTPILRMPAKAESFQKSLLRRNSLQKVNFGDRPLKFIMGSTKTRKIILSAPV